MSVKIKYRESYVNTLYLNYDLEYKGKQYRVCVDWAGGIQDIEIMDENDPYGEYESLYNEDLGMSAKDRLELKEAVENYVLNETDFLENVEIGG